MIDLDQEDLEEERMSPNTPIPTKDTPRSEDDENEFLYDEKEMRGIDADN